MSLPPYRISRHTNITSNASLSGRLAACFLAHLKRVDKYSGLRTLLSITLFLTSFKASAHGLQFSGFGFPPGYSPLQVFAFEVGESAPPRAPGRAGPCVGQGAAGGARPGAGQGGIGRRRGGAGQGGVGRAGQGVVGGAGQGAVRRARERAVSGAGQGGVARAPRGAPR